MSAMSELHHDTAILAEPERPYTMDEWVELRHGAACEAWQNTGLAIDYDTAWRVADAVLRYAIPERVPPSEGR